jgi:hypothetical protein
MRQVLFWSALDETILLDDPMLGKRHNARIDYPALPALLDQLKNQFFSDSWPDCFAPFVIWLEVRANSARKMI